MKADLATLPIDQMRPTVDLAGYWEVEPREACWWSHRLISPQWLLIETGTADCRTAFGNFTAGAGSLVCFRPAPRNVYGMSAGTRFYSLALRFAAPPHIHLVPSLGEEVGALPLHVPLGESFDRVRQQFETICAELPRGMTAEQLRVRGAVFEILAIAREILLVGRRGRTSVGSPAEPMDPWLRARIRLDSSLDKPLPIASLARDAGVSVDHFIRRFRRRFGMNPNAWRIRAKLEEAVRQLRAGQRPVKSIAYDLGFTDPDAFARLFKRHLGVAPSQIRPQSGSMTLGSTTGALPVVPASNSAFITPRGHIFPADYGNADLFDRFTESVSRRPPPCREEDYYFRRQK